eukprot:jgi/Hompol1/1628/HPOL_004497-RA
MQLVSLLVAAFATTAAAIECTGSFCACETGYCYGIDPVYTLGKFGPYRFCRTASDCLKGCHNGYCSVVDFLGHIRELKHIECSADEDCFVHYDSIGQVPKN